MYKKKTIMALVIARGGSKGLLRKNIRLLSGKPLIAWTIDQVKKSRFVDDVIVSTDSKAIAAISKACGAKVPFLRPKRLATDNSKVMDVVLHSMRQMEAEACDILVLLQPTSPLRTAGDIDKAISLLFTKKAKSVISMSRANCNPYSIYTLKNGFMKNFKGITDNNKNRQDFPVFYEPNGAIYLSYWDSLKRGRTFFGKKSFAYLMPEKRSVDIDYEVDFRFAEFLMRDRLHKHIHKGN